MERKAFVNGKVLALISMVAFIGVIAINILASSSFLNGKTTGEVSDSYPNLFTPAGITFSIWSVIYFFLTGFIIYQLRSLFSTSHPAAEKIRSISVLFIANCLANIAWLFSWHYYQIGLSVAIILVMLITLILIHKKLQLPLLKHPLAQKLWLDLPFSIYLGWMSVATIANITALLVSIQWNGFGISAEAWTMAVVIMASCLGVYMVLIRNNFYYTVVVLWALYGILKKLKAEPGAENASVILCINICFVALVILLLTKLYLKRETTFNFFKNIAGNKTPASS